MRKIISVFLCVIMIVSLFVACDNNENKSDDLIDNNTSTTENVTEETTEYEEIPFSEETTKYKEIPLYEEEGIQLTYGGIIDFDLGKEAVVFLNNNTDKTIDFKFSKHNFTGSEVFDEDYNGIINIGKGPKSYARPGDSFMVDWVLYLGDSEPATGTLSFKLTWNFQDDPETVYSKKIVIELVDGEIVEK